MSDNNEPQRQDIIEQQIALLESVKNKLADLGFDDDEIKILLGV